MPSWLSDRLGADIAPFAAWIVPAVIVIGLLFLVMFIAKKILSAVGPGAKGRGPRLAVLDIAAVDQKRKLVLLRRDDVEHLILIGGQNDIVIEAGIGRISAAARLRADTQPRVEPALGDEFDRGPGAPGIAAAGARGGQTLPRRPGTTKPAAGVSGRAAEQRPTSPLARPVPRQTQPLADLLARREAEIETQSAAKPVEQDSGATTTAPTVVAPVWPTLQSESVPVPAAQVPPVEPAEPAAPMPSEEPNARSADRGDVETVKPPIEAPAFIEAKSDLAKDAVPLDVWQVDGERPVPAPAAVPAGERPSSGPAVARDNGMPTRSNSQVSAPLLPPLRKPENPSGEPIVPAPDRGPGDRARRPSFSGTPLPTQTSRPSWSGQSRQTRSLATPTQPKSPAAGLEAQRQIEPEQAASASVEIDRASTAKTTSDEPQGGSSTQAAVTSATIDFAPSEPTPPSTSDEATASTDKHEEPAITTSPNPVVAEPQSGAEKAQTRERPLPAFVVQPPRQTSLAGLLGARSKPSAPMTPVAPDTDLDQGSVQGSEETNVDGATNSPPIEPSPVIRPRSQPVGELPRPAATQSAESRALSVRSFATAIQSRKASDVAPTRVVGNADPIVPTPASSAPKVSAAENRPADPLPALVGSPSQPLSEDRKASGDPDTLEDYLSAELDQDFEGTDWQDVDNRRKADDERGKAETTVPPTLMTQEEPQSRTLTLEEEMERLLGDFDFDVADRKTGGRGAE